MSALAPTQSIEFKGAFLDSTSARAYLPSNWCQQEDVHSIPGKLSRFQNLFSCHIWTKPKSFKHFCENRTVLKCQVLGSEPELFESGRVSGCGCSYWLGHWPGRDRFKFPVCLIQSRVFHPRSLWIRQSKDMNPGFSQPSGPTSRLCSMSAHSFCPVVPPNNFCPNYVSSSTISFGSDSTKSISKGQSQSTGSYGL